MVANLCRRKAETVFKSVERNSGVLGSSRTSEGRGWIGMTERDVRDQKFGNRPYRLSQEQHRAEFHTGNITERELSQVDNTGTHLRAARLHVCTGPGKDLAIRLPIPWRSRSPMQSQIRPLRAKGQLSSPVRPGGPPAHGLAADDRHLCRRAVRWLSLGARPPSEFSKSGIRNRSPATHPTPIPRPVASQKAWKHRVRPRLARTRL